ncbi:MAG: hypothetical protein P4M15_10900 [Alphaproteobacteria bacterium]|nr:hypothetical protein [Alphaproteobacteria bacterium]
MSTQDKPESADPLFLTMGEAASTKLGDTPSTYEVFRIGEDGKPVSRAIREVRPAFVAQGLIDLLKNRQPS